MRYEKLFTLGKEKGIALVSTMLFLTVLGILSTALVVTVRNEMQTSVNYKYTQQAFHVANAGVQRAVQWYRTNYSPHVPAADYDATSLPVRFGGNEVVLAGQAGNSTVYPENNTSTSFSGTLSNVNLQADGMNSGSYAVNATLLKYQPVNFINPATFMSFPSAIERWRLSSVGFWGPQGNPLATARINAIIENSGNALFDRALWGISNVDLGGTVLIDSYDPSLGPYNAATNAGNLGSVGSNGVISANGSVVVRGDVAFGPSGGYSSTSNVTVTGNIFRLPEPRTFPPIPDVCTPTNDDYNPKNGTVYLDPGSYGDINMGPDGVLALSPGVYCFDSISEGSSGAITISGNTTIFVKTSMDLAGQGVLNPLGDPTMLTVYYSGTQRMDITGGAQAYLEVYAPNAPLKFVGTSDFYGSFIGQTVTIQGTPEVHFSEGCLNNNRLQRPFRMLSWSLSPF